MKKINTHFTKHQLKRLEKEARKTGISRAELLRRIVDEFFNKKVE